MKRMKGTRPGSAIQQIQQERDERTHESGAQTWTSLCPSRTRASTRKVRPGELIPSALVTRTTGFFDPSAAAAAAASAAGAEDEDGTRRSSSAAGLESTSPPSPFPPPALLPARTFWRFATRFGGKWLFFLDSGSVIVVAREQSSNRKQRKKVGGGGDERERRDSNAKKGTEAEGFGWIYPSQEEPKAITLVKKRENETEKER